MMRQLRGLVCSVACNLTFSVFCDLRCSCVAVSAICAAPISCTCSSQSYNNSLKLRLRWDCQLPWCVLALRALQTRRPLKIFQGVLGLPWSPGLSDFHKELGRSCLDTSVEREARTDQAIRPTVVCDSVLFWGITEAKWKSGTENCYLCFILVAEFSVVIWPWTSSADVLFVFCVSY
jgi:hypothetical protein